MKLLYRNRVFAVTIGARTLAIEFRTINFTVWYGHTIYKEIDDEFIVDTCRVVIFNIWQPIEKFNEAMWLLLTPIDWGTPTPLLLDGGEGKRPVRNQKMFWVNLYGVIFYTAILITAWNLLQ
jgi:hypothetical protein